MARKINENEGKPIGPDDTDYLLDPTEKPSTVRDGLKHLKNGSRKKAGDLLGDAWASFNIGATNAEHWYVALLDQSSVYYANRDEYEEAEEYSEKAYKHLENKPDKEHLARGRVLRNWSQIKTGTKDYEAAIELSEYALREHELDIESHREPKKALDKAMRHRAVTETYLNRALILSDSNLKIKRRASESLVNFLDAHDPKTLPSEIARVVDFVEECIDPTVRERFPQTHEREFTLNPVKIGKAAVSTGIELGKSTAGKAIRFLPKI